MKQTLAILAGALLMGACTTSEDQGAIHTNGRKIKLTTAHTYVFPTGGGKSPLDVSSKEDLLIRSKLTLNEFSDMVGLTRYDQTGGISGESISIYTLNEQGLPAEGIMSDENGTLLRKAIFSYNEKGERIEVKSVSPDGQSETVQTMTYDEQGNMISVSGMRGTVETKTVFTYDEQGNQIKRVLEEPVGQPQITTDYDYDQLGHCIKETVSRNSEGREVMINLTYTYELDADNNWVVKKKHRNGSLFAWIDREIVYE